MRSADPTCSATKTSPPPHPVPGRCGVRLHAVGVNPFDTYMLAGTYAIKPPLPYSPGADGAGVVEEVGAGVTTVKAGDRVYIGGTAESLAYGAYRQMVICNEAQVHALPATVSFAGGAAVNVPCLTAHVALERGAPRPRRGGARARRQRRRSVSRRCRWPAPPG